MLIFIAMLPQYIKSLLFLFLLFFGRFSYGQILPLNKSQINYTHVLFETPIITNATSYEFIITEIKSNNIIKRISTTNSILLNNLEFAKTYAWKVKYKLENGSIDSTMSNLFYTKPSDQINPKSIRFKCNKLSSDADSNMLILVDYSRVAIDRTGKPVWYLPDIKGKVDATQRIRDLRITDEGTFTFLTNKSAIECDINGNILWEAPDAIITSNDSTGFYHHCFKKLLSGNYMILESKSVFKELPETVKSKISNLHVVKNINDKQHVEVEYGIIQEFDNTGKLVWQWDSEKYISDKDLFSHGNADTIVFFGPHMNSFDIDEAKGLISVGFRDLSRILLIEKKSGEVINSFGKLFASKDVKNQIGFNYQHDSRILKSGNIAIFNNNNIMEDSSVVSSVMIIDPKTGNLIWNFNCNFDSLSNGRSLKGGGVYELQNGNLLVSMGHLNRLFEVTKGKKIVWDGFYERYSAKESKWLAFPQYRISPVISLYPNTFGCSITNNNKNNLEVKINNLGSKTDSYTVNVSDESGKIIIQLKSREIKNGATGAVLIKLKQATGKKILITISSAANKKISKQITLIN